MKLCPTCQRCYEDAAEACVEPGHEVLAVTRSGTREIIGKYRLDVLLSSDAIGDFYSATHIDDKQSFVVKLIKISGNDSEELSNLFLNEAARQAGIDHPNVMPVADYGKNGADEVFVVTEKFNNQTLQQYLKEAKEIPIGAAIKIARQVADGLEAIHQTGIIHRALHPANVILAFDEENRLLAKVYNFDFGGLRQQTVTGSLVGSEANLDALRFMSPEQCARQEIDKRTDIYSLGVVLYTMLSGHPPFDAATSQAIIRKQIHDEPAPLEQLRYDIKALLTHTLMLSLQKKPAERLQSAGNFARRLRHLEYITSHSLVLNQTPLSAASAAPLESTLLAKGEPPVEAPSLKAVEPSPEPTQNGKVMTAAAANTWTPPLPEKNEAIAAFENLAATDEVESVVKPSTDPTPAIVTVQPEPELPEPSVVQNDKIFNQPQTAPVFQTDVRPDAHRDAPLPRPKSQRGLFGLGVVAAILLATLLGAIFFNRHLLVPTPADSSSATVAPTPEPTASVEIANVPNEPINNAASPNVPAANLPNSESAQQKTAPVPKTNLSNNDLANRQVADQTPQPNNAAPKQNEIAPDSRAAVKTAPTPIAPKNAGNNDSAKTTNGTEDKAVLNSSLNQWISATNNRDIDKQMNFYAPTVNSYYRSRNASQNLIRAEKKRVFDGATDVDIKATKPEITVNPDGKTATMRFHKKYSIRSGQKDRNGEVIQELQWAKSNGNWKIVSERDVKVVFK